MRSLSRALLIAATTAAALLVASAAVPTPVGVCKPLSSEFDFPKGVPPHRAGDLAFCKEFRHSTCCTKDTSLAVLRALSAYFDPDSEVAQSFSERCRQLSSVVSCSPCDPLIGTGKRMGICPALCDNWYSACRDGLFTEVEGQLRPCSEGSLICAPLHAIVPNGGQFCERTGFGLGSVSRGPKEGLRLSDDVARLVQRDSADSSDIEEEEVACFDGSVPAARASSSSPSDASAADSAAPGSPGDTPRDSPKRYYKSAEELAAIEARRKARGEELRQAEIDRAWANSPWVLAARSAAQMVRGVMTPLQRSWGRFVRGLPLPRSLTKHLDAPFVFSLVLLAINMMLWNVGRSWIARCCGGAARRRENSVPLSAAAAAAAALAQQQGWTAETHPAASAFSSLSASGLSAEEVRQQRAEKLLQAQYAATSKKQNSSSSADAAEASSSSLEANAAANTYTAIIDGELLTLPK